MRIAEQCLGVNGVGMHRVMADSVLSKRIQLFIAAGAVGAWLVFVPWLPDGFASDIVPPPDMDGFANIEAPPLSGAALGEQRGAGLEDAMVLPATDESQKTAVILWDEVKVPNGGGSQGSGTGSISISQ